MEYNFAKMGDRIRLERKRRGISNQEQFIEMLEQKCNVKIGRNRLSDIENGEQKALDLEFMLGVCKIFDWDMGYLLGEYEETTKDIHDISEYTGLSEMAVRRFHDMKPRYRSAIMPLLEDEGLERAGGFLSFAIHSISKDNSSGFTPWTVTDVSETVFNDDGTITTISSPKEAAKQFVEDAKESVNSTIEMIAIAKWNERRKNKNG